jgi:hypothetical protein
MSYTLLVCLFQNPILNRLILCNFIHTYIHARILGVLYATYCKVNVIKYKRDVQNELKNEQTNHSHNFINISIILYIAILELLCFVILP